MSQGSSRKKKEPDDAVKFIAGAAGGGIGAVLGGPVGAAIGALVVHGVTSWLIGEGL